MLGNKKLVAIAFIVTILIFSGYISNPVWALIASFSAILLGLYFRLKLVELLIISAQFAMYIDFGYNINFTPSIFVLIAVLVTPKFWKTIFANKQAAKYFKVYVYWAAALVLTLVISELTNLTHLSLSNWIDIFKVVIGCLFLLVIASTVFFASISEMIKFMSIWVYSATLIAVAGIIAFFAEMVNPSFISQQMLYSTSRLKGTFEDPNLYAVSVLVALGLSIILAQRSRKYTSYLPIILLAISLSMTNSRGAFFSVMIFVFAGLLLSIIQQIRLFEWMKTSGLAIIVFFTTIPFVTFIQFLVQNSSAILLSAFAFFNSEQAQTFDNQTSETSPEISATPDAPDKTTDFEEPKNTYSVRSDISGDVRFTLWTTAFRMWLAHPLNGVGYGNFAQNSFEYSGGINLGVLLTHNTYLAFLSETGIIGMLLIITPIIFTLFMLLKVKTFQSLALASTFIGLISMSFAYNLQNSQIFWIFIGLAIGFATKNKYFKSGYSQEENMQPNLN